MIHFEDVFYQQCDWPHRGAVFRIHPESDAQFEGHPKASWWTFAGDYEDGFILQDAVHGSFLAAQYRQDQTSDPEDPEPFTANSFRPHHTLYLMTKTTREDEIQPVTIWCSSNVEPRRVLLQMQRSCVWLHLAPGDAELSYSTHPQPLFLKLDVPQQDDQMISASTARGRGWRWRPRGGRKQFEQK